MSVLRACYSYKLVLLFQQLLMFQQGEEESTQINSQSQLHHSPPKAQQQHRNTRFSKKILIILVAAVLIVLQVRSFITEKKVQELSANYISESASLLATQQNLSQLTEKYTEVKSNLKTTELKIEYGVKRFVRLRKKLNSPQPTFSIPRILWLYTEYKLEGEKMVEQFLGKRIARVANESGLEVRLVNSWTAYDHLSQQTEQKITKAMQNMRIDQKVNELLKVALLMEHGGVFVSASEVLLTGSLDWVFEAIKQPTSEVLLFTEDEMEGNSTFTRYQDYFIAAMPRADFIGELFDTLCEAITLKSLRYEELQRAAYVNTEMNVTAIRDIIKNAINGVLNQTTAELFLVSSIHLDTSKRKSMLCDINLFELMKDKALFEEVCGEHKYFITHFDRARLQGEIEFALEPLDDSAKDIPADSPYYQLLALDHNLHHFLPTPPRQVRFCILDARAQQDLSVIQDSLEKLKKQSYREWVAVYYVGKVTQKMRQFMEQENKESQRVVLAKSSSSLGRNYQLGIIKQCPNKSFVVILNRQDSFSSTEGLALLAKNVAPHGILGAYVTMNVSGTLKVPEKTYPNYTKIQMNGRHPKYEDLNSILNHLKVFHSDCYKILPQYSLYTHEGEYYNDRFKFLQAFVQMVLNLTEKHDWPEIPHTQRTIWLIKSNYDFFDVPKTIRIVKEVVININKWEEVDRTEIAKNNFKHDVYPMTYNLDHLLQNGQSLDELAVFNPAHERVPYTKRHKPDIIPKVIHMVWIEGEMSEGKRKIIDMNKELYPDFEFKIWSKANITREQLPLSYQLLNNIYAVNKFTRYSKMATMADVMRHQILYYEGGVYMDTSMILFNKVMYKWLSYKVFLSTEHIFRHRWMQNMCIFAVAPRYPGLLRIIQHRNTNRYNIFLRDAMEIAGPTDFRHLIKGYQEFDEDILMLDLDGFYPMTYAKDNYGQPYCFTQAYHFKQPEEIIYRLNDLVMIKNCGKYYPYSFGKEINSLGSSWQAPRW